MPDSFKYHVGEGGIRLDSFLAQKINDSSRSKIKLAIDSGKIFVNGKVLKASTVLKGSEIIEGQLLKPEPSDIIGENIPLDILHEDDDIIVVNKSAGIVVHPGSGNFTSTLANALVYHFDKLSTIDKSRPGIVHRLDKDTSGVILVAKNDLAHKNLSNQFHDRIIKKTYNAIVWGNTPPKGSISGLIGRNPRSRKAYQVTTHNGKNSLTEYIKKENISPLSFLKLFPLTGRTHQIRVHLKSIGHPIFADELYGGGKKNIKSFHAKYSKKLYMIFKILNRVSLHAERIEIIHPTNKSKMSFSAPLPDEFIQVVNILKND